MSNSVYDADPSDPQALLERIETEPGAFLPGRRNNDIVNWFLTMLLIEPGRDTEYYTSKFEVMMRSLTPTQQYSLASWEIDVADKIRTLNYHYGHLTSPGMIMSKWIPMDYAHVPQVHAGQTKLG